MNYFTGIGRRAGAARRAIIGALAMLAAVPVFAGYPSPADWRDETIYQLLTDRWDNVDTSNDALSTTYSPATGNRTHGGDFKGLKRRLNYVRGLGATSIWISPIVSNANGEYHGYAADDFTSLAPHWGSLADLQDFVNTAHSSGTRVLLDMVCNHGGDLINNPGAYKAPPASYTLSYRSASKQHKAPFTALSNWHAQGGIGNWVDPEQILGELSGLDDLKTETDYVRTNMATIYSNWVTSCDFDGFRVDTVKHVDIGFWQYWCPALHTNATAAGKSNFFMFGEVLEGSDSTVGKFTGTKAGGAFCMDSCLDYPLYFATNGVFGTASSGAQNIVNHYNALASNYDSAAQNRLVTFLDNHDQVRFLSSGVANGKSGRLEAALVFQLTSLGVPCVYYGTEQRFNGGADPANREDMFAGSYESGPSVGNNFDQTAPTYRLIRKLNQFRRDHAPLRRGTLTSREVHSTPGIFAYTRDYNGESVLVAVNTSDSAQTAAQWQTSWPAGTVVVDRFDGTFTRTVGTGGTIAAGTTISGNGYRLLIPQASVTDLDPEVTACGVTMGGTIASVTTPLTLTFSEAMNKASVVTALSFTPTVSGVTASWSAGDTVLTLTPPAEGWPGSSSMSLLISESAADTGGKTLRGGFEREFKTPATPDLTGIDGTISGDAAWNGITAAATQTVKTHFGDNTNTAPDQNSGGSEADQIFLRDDSANLYVGITGNVQPNGNALNLFFDLDGAAGGVSTLTAGTTAFLTGQSAAGTIMPTGIKTDLILRVQLTTPGQTLVLQAYKWNAAGQLVSEGAVGTLAPVSGQPTKGAITGTIAGTSYTFRAAYNNSNVGPVTNGSAAPWTASPNGAGAATGMEIQIPKTLLGNGPYKIFAGLSGSTGYWSNQFLPPMIPADNLAWAPNLANAGVVPITYAAAPATITLWSIY